MRKKSNRPIFPPQMRSEYKIVLHISTVFDSTHDARSSWPFYLISIRENSCVSMNGMLDLIIEIDERTARLDYRGR